VFLRVLEPADDADSTRATVATSQRARMLDAVTRAVVDKGYARMTVADIVSRAEVSRRTFYEQFENKEDCFLAAYEAGAQAVIGDIVAAVTALPSDDGWRERTGVALEAFTAALAASPEFARVFLVDVLGAGHRAVELRQRVYDLFGERLHLLALRASTEDSSIRLVPELVVRALVGGIGELVQRHILTEGAASLGELSPALTELAIQIIEGSRARVEEGPPPVVEAPSG
jgi:AcrR family transcriptional regulator